MPDNSGELGVGNQHQHRPERGIFGNSPSPEARFINDRERFDKYVESIRGLDLSIVLTSGTFDLLHIGHMRYLEEAKKCGDILIVGVDSDEKVRARKGPDRPVVPECERVDSLAHVRSVDLITLKKHDEPKWDLIKRVRPDTLIVTQETYSEQTLDELAEFCGKVVCLEPQATTSTSARIRLLRIGWGKEVIDPIEQILEEENAPEELRRKIGTTLLALTREDNETRSVQNK